MKRMLVVVSVFVVFGSSFSLPAAGSSKKPVVHKIGDTCKPLGSLSKNSKQELECRASVNNVLKYFDNSRNSKKITNLDSPLSLSECRISDQRTRIIQNIGSIAYPAKPWDPNFTSKSQITTAIVPIDFGDAKGKNPPSKRINEMIKASEDFAKWFSRGNLKLKWVTTTKWIRGGDRQAEFNWVHPSSSVGSTDDGSLSVGTKLIALADKSLDISDVQDFFFVYPDSISKIKDSINFGGTFTTSQGARFFGVYADSVWLQGSMDVTSMWLMHERMHKFGYSGHAPAYPMLFSIAHDQSGPSQVFNLWDRMVLDWLNPTDIYCTNLSSLKGEEITLVPTEREQIGVQGVTIKINDHKLLILESHRRDKWSMRYPRGFVGITAMIVDTQFDTDRSGEYSGDDGKGKTNVRTANYLQFAKYDHGTSPIFTNSYSFPLNYLLYPGEEFDYEGVNVKFISSNFNDTIRISKQ